MLLDGSSAAPPWRKEKCSVDFLTAVPSHSDASSLLVWVCTQDRKQGTLPLRLGNIVLYSLQVSQTFIALKISVAVQLLFDTHFDRVKHLRYVA